MSGLSAGFMANGRNLQEVVTSKLTTGKYLNRWADRLMTGSNWRDWSKPRAALAVTPEMRGRPIIT